MKTIQHKTFRDCEVVVSDAPRKINSYGIVLGLTEAESEKLAKIAGFYVMADPSDVEAPAEAEVGSTEDEDGEDGDEVEETDEVATDEKPVARVDGGSQKKRGRPAGKRGK